MGEHKLTLNRDKSLVQKSRTKARHKSTRYARRDNCDGARQNPNRVFPLIIRLEAHMSSSKAAETPYELPWYVHFLNFLSLVSDA